MTTEFLQQVPYSKRLITLFFTYLRITSVVIGGGYAIIAASEDYFVKREKWISEEEMVDIIALTQMVPGILACNSAICIGMKIAGFWGAISALLGAITPSITIITMIAYILNHVLGTEILSNPFFCGVFQGIAAAITAMILVLGIRMWKKIVLARFELWITLFCFILMVCFKVNPGFIILGVIPIGCWRIYTIQKLEQSL